MTIRITTSTGRTHFTNDMARARRFAARTNGTIARYLFGGWVIAD